MVCSNRSRGNRCISLPIVLRRRVRDAENIFLVLIFLLFLLVDVLYMHCRESFVV